MAGAGGLYAKKIAKLCASRSGDESAAGLSSFAKRSPTIQFRLWVALWVEHRRELLFSFKFSALSILNGGGGGDRTRVREPSAVGPTCLARSIVFNLPTPEGQGDWSAILN